MIKMTAKQIEQALGKDRITSGDKIVCCNVNFVLKGQQDLLAVTSTGLVVEYEIKVTRSDFFRDKVKGKDQYFKMVDIVPDRIPNKFYYVVPIGLVEVDEVPDWAGLIYITENLVPYSKKAAPLIHKHKHDLQKIYRKITTLYQQRQFLGCCLMTYKNRQTRALHD